MNTRPSKVNSPKARLRPRGKFWSVVDSLFRLAGLLTWFVVLVLALLEIKRYYNIDIIPGYNSSLDDVYGAARGTLSEFLD